MLRADALNHRSDAARQFQAALEFAVRVVICLYSAKLRVM